MEQAAEKQTLMTVSALPVVNYALYRNNVPVVRSVTVVNETDLPIENAELSIASAPDICLPYSLHIDCIPARRAYEIKDIKLLLNAELLAGVTEKLNGTLTVTLTSGGETVAAETMEFTALAFDQWHGSGFYPELLVSFMTPNQPALAPIITRASNFLKDWTADPSFDAYQSRDPDRVLKQAAAIFCALKEQGIVYSVSPASFEEVGQRVRLCDTVLQQKLGCCLDLTLLYASCLEAVGLHPLLIMTSKHIFTGVWLEESTFPDSVQSDGSMVTKRLAKGINEIAVMESTMLTSDSDFDAARQTAAREFAGADPIEYIIDVRRARLSGVSPLPQRIHTESGWHIETETAPTAASAPRPISDTIIIAEAPAPDDVPRKTQWERKLLDLGLRNSLINLRLSRTLIPILSSSLSDLEDALSDGDDFSLLPRPSDWRGAAEPDFENIHELGSHEEMLREEFKNNRLRSPFTEGELSSAIKTLYRTSRTALEENGANTLYLALGLLRWFESDRSTKPRYAPIVLIPIEMVRRSASQGYAIRLRDDEPQMNITLLEKIKQDFGITVTGVDPLPADDHGIDLRMVFTILRKAVMEQSRWDILESAYLGIFSFSQFVMWNDLRSRSDDLAQNKIVKSLMEGKLAWEAKSMQIGDQVPEDNVYLPMSADASQLYAIQSACDGASFVLHGPPGTGKSQTITSLIANALAQGKSVLFAAEKMAALSVVQKRLESIGIGPFCLELHSNKSRKRDVLEQLRIATEVTKTVSSEQYAEKAEQASRLRAELDAYAKELHKPLPCGKTLYDLVNEYETYRSAPDLPAFPRDFVRTLTSADLEAQQTLLERLTAAGRATGHPHGNPLSPIKLTTYSQQLRADLTETVTSYKTALTEATASAAAFAQAAGTPTPTTFTALQNLTSIAKELPLWQSLPQSWAAEQDLPTYLNGVQETSDHYIKANSARSELLKTYREEFLQLDAAQLSAEYNAVISKWFLPRALGMNKLTRKLTPYAAAGVSKSDIGGHILTLNTYQTEQKAAKTLFEQYGKDLTENADWSAVLTNAQKALQSAANLTALTGSETLRTTHCGKPEPTSHAQSLITSHEQLLAAQSAYRQLLCAEEEPILDRQSEICENILSNSDDIREWIAYNGIAAETVCAGLQSVVTAYTEGTPHGDLIPSYKKALLFALINDAIDGSEPLNTFSGAVFDEKISQLTRIDKELTRLSKTEIFCRLAARLPDFSAEAAHSSELGILQRMIKSGGRGTSIRKLFEQLPNLLPRLCPCMLMSPISAAQYLDPKRQPFDIVVFDEASQLPTCKAVGVLARGRDAVIVGDPKQMPPTSFFSVNAVDEDNLEAEDLESILDDCLALNMPQTHLLWHYRSRHESLIAFSNRRFYENRLYTFPSVNDRESKVTLVKVDGVFDRGKTRRNLTEAEAVVSEIKRRCHDPELNKLSVGVVTFNISQQNLIDDLLNEACRNDGELEKWLYGSEEPIFIKNLENVQGDERDVILFSIGYGKDKEGKLYMNFGPLNRDGGWRRLNVAVSRARCEMTVFSSITADDINLSRTSAEGVAALKDFLDYAEKGKLSAASFTSADSRTKEGTAEAIRQALHKAGYDSDIHVGQSEYKLDIAVIDPKDPEKYLLGILLDGSSYGKAKTTRDREIAQISVLKGLGWSIHRVWTMDWWDNSKKETDRIIAKLHDIEQGITEPRQEEEPTPAPEPQPLQPTPPPTAAIPTLAFTDLLPLTRTAEDIMKPSYTADIQSRAAQVLEQEAPIIESSLIKRVLQSYGISRSTPKLQSRISETCTDVTRTSQGEDSVLWKKGQDPDNYFLFRKSDRSITEVPARELSNALCYVLHRQIGLSEEDLVREAANLMGYPRMGSNIASALTSAVKGLQQDGLIEQCSNNNLTLTQTGNSYAEKVLNALK